MTIDIDRLGAARSYVLDGVSSGQALDDTSSPQYAALLWVVSDDTLSPISRASSDAEIEKMLTRYILALLYYSLSGGRWLSAVGWLDGRLDHCSWEYIFCDNGSTSVLGINTGGDNFFGGGGAGMQGSLPSELNRLTSLGA
jgi:hypothetical protein